MPQGPQIRAPHPWFSRWFADYAARRLRRNFFRVRLLGELPGPFPPEVPLVIYGNHASWWDPLIALATRPIFFPTRESYAPIDAVMLERYGIFKSLGFFGVDRSSIRGVTAFLDHAEAILHRPDVILLITPQGRFADVRERPLGFQKGIACLAQRVPNALFLPLAAEICYWEESKPEILLHLGPPFHPDLTGSRDAVLGQLEGELEGAMDRLSQASIARDPSAFRDLFVGSAGVGGVYDLWRSLKGWLTGRPVNLLHGNR